MTESKSDAEQIAELEEEAVRLSAQLARLEEAVGAQRAAVSGEQHRTGTRLIGDQPVGAQPTTLLPRRRDEGTGRRADQDRIIRARVVAQRLAFYCIVFTHHADEQRTQHLILELE